MEIPKLDKNRIAEEIISKPTPLSVEQKVAVISPHKYVRVIAGAGAGKTETLTRRIVYLLLHEEVEPRSIVAFTFTEKAAQSMKTRIYERVRQLQGKDACAKLGEMYVGTIHGYCLQLLEDYFGYGDYEVLDENQEMAFLLREGWSLGLGVGGRYAANCQTFLRTVNVVYDELLDRDLLKQKSPTFASRLGKYEALLDQHRLLTFARMVALAVKCLEREPAKIKHIKHLIVDEYQDINRAQEKLIQIIGKNAAVFIVGDPRQCIYQWRGSDQRCFDDFVRYFDGAASFEITENRRSAKAIVEAANEFSKTFESTSFPLLHPTRLESGIAVLVKHQTPEDEGEWIARQIERYVSSGRARYGDCAILLRSVTTSAAPFLNALRNRNMPYIIGGKVGLFRRDEAQCMGMLFSWLSDEGFWVRNRWNWNDQIRGDDLLETGLRRWTSSTGMSITAHQRTQLQKWKQEVLDGSYENFAEVHQELLVILGFRNLDPNDKLHAAVMANLGRFSTLLADYESSIRLGGNTLEWPKAVKGLCWYMNTYASGAYEEQATDDIRGIDAVQVMTVHQAKGLEWPIVFVPALTARRFPTSNVGRQQEWHITRETFDVNRYEGNLEDEKRLFYVAITRARDVLCLSYFERLTQQQSKSPFIRDIQSKLQLLTPNTNLPLVEISSVSTEEDFQTFSAGEIITYLRCPYFYRLREVWHYKPGLVTPLGYGKSLHYCLRYAAELIANGISPKVAVEKAVDEKFHIPYAGGQVRENMKRKARKDLIKFVEKYEEDMHHIEEVEARLEFPLQKATVTGRVDVILNDRRETVEVRDYKTSEEVTTFEQAALQVQLYALGLRMIGRPINCASLAYLERAEVKKVDISPENIDFAKTTAQKCIEGIKNGIFKPKQLFCDKCDQRRICRWKK